MPPGAVRKELVAGERRWRAAAMAGLGRVPVIVRELDDEACATWGLVENLQREDLDPIEKGEACRVMIERFGMSPQGLSERLGVDRSTIVNMVRLTELEPSIQRLVRAGDLTMGHARSLLSVPRESGARLRWRRL
ncbi:MAG: ParB/RepB/Spo0J family partition protein [Phycisphaeraceae bacterium]|nr:ParB/RepB/Spo0J family partition protein [Phycisphaeraceae bacterium]